MKIGILSDAHGNYPGLDRTLLAIKELGVRDIFFLGDAVGYLPDINRVLDRLKKEKIHSLMGNHEAMLLGLLPIPEASEKMYKLFSARKTISRRNLLHIKKLLPFHSLQINKWRILFVHGSPAQPLDGYVYPDSDLSKYGAGDYDFIFMGHTHRPFIRVKNGVTWVNVGSCGLPRDTGNLASFAIFDTKTGKTQIYRIPLDIDDTMQIYGDDIHEGVIDCLHRSPSQKPVGTILQKL